MAMFDELFRATAWALYARWTLMSREHNNIIAAINFTTLDAGTEAEIRLAQTFLSAYTPNAAQRS